MTNSEIARGIAHWLQCNPMAPENQFKAAYQAWLSCLNADRNDNRSELCQRLHRMNLARFAESQTL